jgi:hypothetical protein
MRTLFTFIPGFALVIIDELPAAHDINALPPSNVLLERIHLVPEWLSGVLRFLTGP